MRVRACAHLSPQREPRPFFLLPFATYSLLLIFQCNSPSILPNSLAIRHTLNGQEVESP